MTIDGADWKLIQGNAESQIPGPHMPNQTEGGVGDSIVCTPGCLFNLTADYIEHNELGKEPAYASIMQTLLARYGARFSTGFCTRGVL
jgi:hypothetical protein